MFYFAKTLLYFFKHFLFLRDRGRQSTSGGGAEREREREEDAESETGSRLRSVSTEPNVGLKLVTCEIMT